jgi:hypothetical protein
MRRIPPVLLLAPLLAAVFPGGQEILGGSPGEWQSTAHHQLAHLFLSWGP